MTEQFPSWLAGCRVARAAERSTTRPTGMRFLAASDNANLQLVRAPFDGRRSR